MIICIPCECQNGHKAIWRIEICGLDTVTLGVKPEDKCDCPKHDFGQGYDACGKPYLQVEEVKSEGKCE